MRNYVYYANLKKVSELLICVIKLDLLIESIRTIRDNVEKLRMCKSGTEMFV